MSKVLVIPEMIFGYVGELSAAAHPNALKLTGVLVRLDEPSTKAPHGSYGHRIVMPSDVAAKRVSSLVNMGLNYAPSLKDHAARRKVGVITKAWIDGKDLKVEATVWKKDFPEAERDLKRSGLGMSMEISEVKVKDPDASIWVLSDFVFTGATVLEKTSAAYFKTLAIAAARSKEKESAMAVNKKKVVTRRSDEDVIRLAVTAATQVGTDLLASALKPLVKVQERIMIRMDALEASSVEASEEEEEDDLDVDAAEDCPPNKMKAKKKPVAEDEDDSDDDEDDEDEIDSEVDTGDEEEMGPGPEDDEDDEPGALNKSAKNKGRKTTSENKVGKTVSSARLKAALARERDLSATIQALQEDRRRTAKRLKRLEEQVTVAAAATQRRSELPKDLQNLLRKGGVDPIELQASGEKLSVEQVDAFLDGMKGSLPNVKRIEFKNILRNNRMMD